MCWNLNMKADVNDISTSYYFNKFTNVGSNYLNNNLNVAFLFVLHNIIYCDRFHFLGENLYRSTGWTTQFWEHIFQSEWNWLLFYCNKIVYVDIEFSYITYVLNIWCYLFSVTFICTYNLIFFHRQVWFISKGLVGV